MKKSATLSLLGTKMMRKCPWRTRSRNQWKRISSDFDILRLMVSVARPMVTSLSQKSGVGGWVCLMSSKIWRSLVAMRPAAKSSAYSASATNEQTTGIRVEWMEMGWLSGASSLWSLRKWVLPATLPARGSGKVGGVGERVEDYLGGAEYFPPVRVGGGVPEEAVEAGHGVGIG